MSKYLVYEHMFVIFANEHMFIKESYAPTKETSEIATTACRIWF